MKETLRSKLGKLNLGTLAIGYYRILTSVNNLTSGSPPEITGPYPNKTSATPIWQRMGARIYFLNAHVEFHIFKPKGATPPDPAELMKIE